MSEQHNRNSGIELLRILIMLQIVFLHVYQYGQYSQIVESIAIPDFYASRLIWAFCRAPVNSFILITGYFMLTKPFNLKESTKRLPRVYAQVLFYSLAIALIFFIVDPMIFKSAGVVLRSFFPIVSRQWYFISLYFIILLLSPFMNAMLNGLDKKQYQILLGICFFVFSIWPNLADLVPINETVGIDKVVLTQEGKSLYSFIFMYALGGYLCRFFVVPDKPRVKYLIAFLGLCIIDFSLFALSDQTSGGYLALFGRFDNPLVVLETVMLFLFFLGIKWQSNLVNRMASTMLGVYLIHEQPFLRNWLWNLFDTDNIFFYSNDAYMIKLFLIVFGVFLSCVSIDLLRQWLFAAVDKIWHQLNQKSKPNP